LECPMYFTDSTLKVIEHVYLLLKTLQRLFLRSAFQNGCI